MSRPATTPSAPASTAAQSLEACRAIFGASPEDVLIPADGAKETLFQLAEIFRSIAHDALDGRNGQRIKHLAEAGAYLASDFGNFVDCELERLRDNLHKAGVMGEQP